MRHKSRDELDQILKEDSVQGRTKTTLHQWGIFVAAGLFMVALPLYIYASPMFDLPIREAFSQVVAVTLVGGLLLAWAYRSVSLQRRIALLTTHQPPPASKGNEKGAKKEREEAQAHLEKSVADLCCAYSLFTVNSAFVLLWLMTAFYFLPKFSTDISPSVNCFLGITAPALLLAAKGTVAF
mmetsp:Transcript_4556/g.13891  ORF Transcript_4556/g.13891 Transcript_4556/m.13891 type:complete len:182 (-) Transcript_4556:149-694(-)